MVLSTTRSSSTSSPLKVANDVHTVYTLSLPQYTVSVSIGTTLSFLQATKIILDTGCKYDDFCRSMLPLGRQRHVSLDQKMISFESGNINLLLISSTVILCIRLESNVCGFIFLVSNYFSEKVPIDTQSMNHQANSMRCIN